MSKQLFKEEIPIELLTQFLDKVTDISSSVYLLDMNVYKRIKYHKYHFEFLSSLIPYYHWSKQFYLERDFTYLSFITIIRQICKLHFIKINKLANYQISFDKNIL